MVTDNNISAVLSVVPVFWDRGVMVNMFPLIDAVTHNAIPEITTSETLALVIVIV